MKKLLTALTALFLVAGAFHASAQLETAFTYQGRLIDTNGLANGLYDFIFSLYDNEGAQVADGITNSAVSVVDGHFTQMLDFGPNSFRRYVVPPRGFIGPGEWLEISVRTNRSKTYEKLAPRQRLTPTPFASTVTGTLPSSAIEGVYTGKVNFGNGSNVFAGRFYGDGSNLTNVGSGSLWQLAGNAGTTPGAHFLGTTDNQALELRVNGERGLRLEPGAASPNLVGGFVGNSVGAGSSGAVIAGGGSSADTNRVTASYAAVSGGAGNASGAIYATISGGRGNTVQPNSTSASIGGGYGNTVGADAGNSVIGGGMANIVGVSAEKATIAGGSFHQASAAHAAIGGGERNQAVQHATVGGGYRNKASGNYSVVAGGMTNVASGLHSVVSGGEENEAAGGHATVGGGGENAVSGAYATIGGGWRNQVDASYATVSGGRNNTASALYGTVAGGSFNTAAGAYATVAGGNTGQASGNYSVVVGGLYNGASGFASLAAGDHATAAHDNSFIWSGDTSRAQATTGAGQFKIHAPGGALFHTGTNALYASGDMSCAALVIRGGADLAEPFAISDPGIQPGAVVVIDPEHPGRLKQSTTACDPKVAGVVSGAGGVLPGISMIQTERLEGGRNVALSGRVYTLVDATEHPVQPGDLLTTSDTAGHAMKAIHPAMTQGALLGKAMTPLAKGRGLVLVLVNLQ